MAAPKVTKIKVVDVLVKLLIKASQNKKDYWRHEYGVLKKFAKELGILAEVNRELKKQPKMKRYRVQITKESEVGIYATSKEDAQHLVMGGDGDGGGSQSCSYDAKLDR